MLVEVLRAWVGEDLSSRPAAPPEVITLAGATELLVQEGLICVYRDDLDDADLTLLDRPHACAAVSDGGNWWRGELQQDPDPARSVFVLQGRQPQGPEAGAPDKESRGRRRRLRRAG